MSSQNIFIPVAQPVSGELAQQIFSLVGLTCICILFGIKTHNVKYRSLTYARWLVLSLYICSWTFTAASIVLAYTNYFNPTSCYLSIVICDIFYAGTKLIIYLWLIERAFIVSDGRQRRMESWVYKFHLVLMTPYIGIFALMMIYHNADIDPLGICLIGLQPIANIPLLVYDTIFNLYMTVLFVIPLVRVGRGANSEWRNSRLYSLTKRTLIASTICLVTSFANACAATLLGGKQPGYLCLVCCCIDIIINICTIHWVTNPSKIPRQTKTKTTVSTENHSDHTSGGSYPKDKKKNISHEESMVTDHTYSFNFQKHSANDNSTLGPLPSSTDFHDYTADFNSHSLNIHHTNRSSISIQDSQCSTKSLTKAAQVMSTSS
ncbi:unnamed protein product [Cunninghamella blakesleeana]